MLQKTLWYSLTLLPPSPRGMTYTLLTCYLRIIVNNASVTSASRNLQSFASRRALHAASRNCKAIVLHS